GSGAEAIHKILKGMNLKKGSQCFHRAYLWAFDTSTKQNLFTEKAFLFFTPKYIRQYRYKWWFHVAPLLRNPLAPDQDRMIDPWFLTGPRPIQRWTDEFMKNKAVCPVIPVYVAHDQHYADGWCYMRITPMYYYHPNTVALADLEGRIETEFEERGLKYSEAAARR
ncbi:MAG: protein-glutamine glutaminase family protein, partial [Bdellovibrionota bacterium]